MKNDHTSLDFKKLLDKLQTESWQLELIISGFAIYGLFTIIDPLELRFMEAQIRDERILGMLWGIVLNSVQVLQILLLIHVILRGLWIGTIGLRYVSGDIDYEKLNYSEKFTHFLTHQVVHFVRLVHISTIEKLYVINIDSTTYKKNFVATKSKKNRFGFETYLNIKDLKNGKHILTLKGPVKKKDSTMIDTLLTIPFWHYKQ